MAAAGLCGWSSGPALMALWWCISEFLPKTPDWEWAQDAYLCGHLGPASGSGIQFHLPTGEIYQEWSNQGLEGMTLGATGQHLRPLKREKLFDLEAWTRWKLREIIRLVGVKQNTWMYPCKMEHDLVVNSVITRIREAWWACVWELKKVPKMNQTK